MSADIFSGSLIALGAIGSVALAALATAIAAFRRRHRSRVVTAQRHQRETDQEARFLAFNDPVTRLPNRARFKQEAADFINAARKADARFDLYYCVFQLPGIQDAHAIGCAASAIADQLRLLTCSSDLLARYDRCEFVLLRRREAAGDSPARTRLQLLEACKNATGFDGNRIHPEVHVGHAEHPRDGSSFRNLLVAAARAPAPESIIGAQAIASRS